MRQRMLRLCAAFVIWPDPIQGRAKRAARSGMMGDMSTLQPMRWGLIGPGRIAHRFADALGTLPDACLQAVAGRSPQRTHEFAARWGARAAPSVDALLADAGLDAVYVATSHAAHGPAVRAALLAGKHVLCEKPLVPTAAEAQELVDLARQQGLLLMEAVWTRCLPALQALRERLQQAEIGALRSMQSSFCFAVPHDPASRLFDPAQAGGALLDIGIYNLSVTRWVLHSVGDLSVDDPGPDFDVHGRVGTTGVDERVHAQLRFASGVVAQMVCALDGEAENTFVVHGERGCLVLQGGGFWQATQLRRVHHHQADEVQQLPFRHNGFEYEIEEAMRCIRAGQVESPLVPHRETLATLRWIDALRERLGVHYPFEGPRPVDATIRQ
jgi:predicted dehydrogenase